MSPAISGSILKQLTRLLKNFFNTLAQLTHEEENIYMTVTRERPNVT